MTSIDLQDTDLRKGHTKALKLVELFDKLSKTAQDTDLRMPRAMANDSAKTSHSSFLTSADGELAKSTEDTEKTLQDSMVSLGLFTNRDTDLRNQFAGDENQETRGKTDLEVPRCLLFFTSLLRTRLLCVDVRNCLHTDLRTYMLIIKLGNKGVPKVTLYQRLKFT